MTQCYLGIIYNNKHQIKSTEIYLHEIQNVWISTTGITTSLKVIATLLSVISVKTPTKAKQYKCQSTAVNRVVVYR